MDAEQLEDFGGICSLVTMMTFSSFLCRGLELGDDEHVDAEQLEEESRISKSSGLGVGATLRAYWNATVQDEVELRFNTVRT